MPEIMGLYCFGFDCKISVLVLFRFAVLKHLLTIHPKRPYQKIVAMFPMYNVTPRKLERYEQKYHFAQCDTFRFLWHYIVMLFPLSIHHHV